MAVWLIFMGGAGKILSWEASALANFGTAPIALRHSLADHPLFSEQALARVLETLDRSDYFVNTMAVDGHVTASRREGEISGLSGAQVLEAVRTGTIWILLLNPAKANPEYAALLDSIYGEMEQAVPGFRTRHRKMTLLISSPNVQVHYHCDIPGQTLWQIRGRKRVFIYPNNEPFLDQPALERIAIGEAHEFSLPYREEFDAQAKVFDLEPGLMMHWPLNAPHRIVNADCVNVSFTTEHFTVSNRRTYHVNYANGVLRNWTGRSAMRQSIAGPSYWAKFAVATAHKYLRPSRKRSPIRVDFTVDPQAPNGVRTIPAYEVPR